MEARQTIIKFLSGKYKDITGGIYSGSAVLTEILDDGKQLDFKGCNANSFEVKVAGISDMTLLGEKISVVQKIGTSTEQLFTGIIDSAEMEGNKTYRKIIAYDEMYSKSSVNITDFYNNYFNNKSKVTIKQFRDAMFEHIGIEQVETTLINDNVVIRKSAAGIVKFGDIIANICEINGVFGNINRYGKFEYVNLSDKQAVNVSENVRSSGKIQDYTVFPITQVELQTDKENIAYITGKGNSFIVHGNSLLYGMTEAELKPIAEKLLKQITSVIYVPVDIKTIIADLNLLPGTKIEFSTRNKEMITTYVMSNKLSGIQMFTQQITANGDKTRKETVENTNADLNVLKKAMLDKLDVYEANLTYATIDNLNVTNEAVIKKLDVDEANLTYAKIEDLNVEKEKVNIIEANMLTSNSAIVKALQADIADVNTLIFGSASGTTIQTEFSNSVIAQLGDAQIKSAMIDNLSADKIKSGVLYTNLVEITSQSGNIDIKDNTFKITDNNSIPRIQIGKDASEDYNMYIWDSSGNLMFDALGLTDKGIKREIIRNDMVSQNANISAEKLDIDTLFGVINSDGSHTLKSSKIYVDAEGQTMDIAFKKLTDKTDAIEDTVTSQGTAINVVQGQINTKIWQQDITTAVNDIEIGGRNLIIQSELNNGYINKTGTVVNKSSNAYKCTNHIPVSVNKMIIFQMWFPENEKVWINVTYFDENQNYIKGYINDNYFENGHYIEKIIVSEDVAYIRISFSWKADYKYKLESGTKATDWTPAPEDTDVKISTLSTNYTKLDQSLTGLTAEVAGNTSKIATKADNSTVTEIQNNLTTVTADLDGFKTTVSSTYTTKSEHESVETHISTVEQTADKINWIVKSGSSESNFTLTDRLAELTAEIISLNGNVKVSKDMIVDGAITAKKIATDAIKSRNYIKDKYGSYLNLTNGSFDSPWLKFSSSGLSIGSIKVTTDTDDYGKVKGGIYAELVNSDSGTVGGHGEVYRTFLNPTILENINTTYVLGFSVYNSYDMSWIRTPFSVRSDGWIRTDSNIIAKGYLSISQFIKANGDIWSDNGCVRTGNGGITADGRFYSQSTEYPNISGNGTYLHLNYTNENTKGLVCENGSVRPAGDSNQSLGRTDKRWSTVYAFTSAISTSDRNEKNTINDLDETLVLDFIKGLKPVSYKYNNGTSGRTHMGLISQDIEELLTSLGLDSLDFAGFIKSPKIETTETENTDENGNPVIETEEQIIENEFNYGLRYEEFISPLIKFVQIQEDRITSLEEQVKNQQREIEELKINLKGGI